MDAAAVAEDVQALRASFNSGRMRTAEQRRTALLAFQKMLLEGRSVLEQALWKDLHKSPPEGYFFEVNQVEHEVQHMLDHLEEFMAPEARSTNIINLPGQSEIHKDPLGVVLVIGAWNYPVNLSLVPVVGALAAGNIVLLKMPSDEYTPNVSTAVATLIRKYMDADVVRVIEGGREATQAVLQPRYDLMFFTGGAFVGKMVAEAAARTLTPTILELGGKSPVVVTKTANVQAAARRVVWGAFTNAGQTCVRPDHVFCHAAVADDFFRHARAAAAEYYGSNPKASEFFCRLVNERAGRRLAGIVEKDRRHVVHGGDVDLTAEGGAYVAPTLMDFKEDEAAFFASASMEDEIFGPVLPVLRFTDLDRVLDSINAKEKPLALYCFSGDSKTSDHVLARTTSGGAVVNDLMVHLSNADLPFGGVGNSGMGSYHGEQSFNSFSHRRSVLKRFDSWLDFPGSPLSARYPPYDAAWKIALLGQIQAVHSAATTRMVKWGGILLAVALGGRAVASRL